MQLDALRSGTRPTTLLYHLMALATCFVWAMTFISTKTLINAGLNPTEIFIMRFVIAYAAIVAICHDRLLSGSWKDEGLMALAGLTGGSVFFIAQNTALELTYASDVSLLICTAPLFTMILQRMTFGTPLNRKMITGALIGLGGVGLVVMNGTMTLGANPLGDLLTLVSAILWAVYCMVLERIGSRYPTMYVTRKVFFYGLVSAIIIAAAMNTPFHPELLKEPVVAGNILFLGLLASMACYSMWSAAVRVLGPAKTSTYIYLQPLVTVVASVLLLDEPVTVYVVSGCVLILGGVYLAER